MCVCFQWIRFAIEYFVPWNCAECGATFLICATPQFVALVVVVASALAVSSTVVRIFCVLLLLLCVSISIIN